MHFSRALEDYGASCLGIACFDYTACIRFGSFWGVFACIVLVLRFAFDMEHQYSQG